MKSRHIPAVALVAAFEVLGPACRPAPDETPVAAPTTGARTTEVAEPIAEYREVKSQLARGWNTWHTRSVLTHVLLPDGFAINLAFRQTYWLGGSYLREALIGRGGEGTERVRPGLHALDGSYTQLELEWEQVNVRVETAADGDELVILITPLVESSRPVHLVVESGVLWNRAGALSREGTQLRARLPSRSLTVDATRSPDDDPYHQTMTPHLSIPLEGPIGLSTGGKRSLAEIRDRVADGRAKLEAQSRNYGDLAEAWLAVQAGLAWNTVYEPMHDRVLTTVGRLWNEERGGYAMFGWDNFFLAYMTGLYDRELAIANVIEQVRGATEEGFIPNDNQANGRKSWDRSQPPVGAIMVREVYRRFPERWLLEASFDGLLAWNRWWPRKRMNDGLLSWGSHEAKNPLGEPNVRTMVTARYESGMDDSPMYEDVPFDRKRGLMHLQDVGLNALYVVDCRALAELAAVLEREEEREELSARAEAIATEMERLWSPKHGLYLNRRTDTGELSGRVSPTMFYPLLAGVGDTVRHDRIVEEHVLDPEEFWGDWVLPSIARSDPSFPRQRYWKGAIWPPLNFLTYLGLRQTGHHDVAKRLSEKSLAMFLAEWRRKGYVSENYSAIDGSGDHERLSSDNFHSWGALFGFMAFIESGDLAPTEAPLQQ